MAKKGQGGTQSLRIKTHKVFSKDLLLHVLGEKRPDTRRPVTDGHPAVVLLVSNLDEAELAINILRAARKGMRGAKPTELVELAAQGAGRYGSGYEWPREKEHAFEQAYLEWLQETFPESIFAAGAAHRDETTHHSHVAFVPIGNGKLGWVHAKDAFMDRFLGVKSTRVRNKKNASAQYQALQDDFHEKVGKRFGLERGARDGRIVYEEHIDRAIALEEREKITRREAEEQAALKEKAEQERLQEEERCRLAEEAKAAAVTERDQALGERDNAVEEKQQAAQLAEQKRLEAEAARQAAEAAERRQADAEAIGKRRLSLRGAATRRGEERIRSFENQMESMRAQNAACVEEKDKRIESLVAEQKTWSKNVKDADEARKKAVEARGAAEAAQRRMAAEREQESRRLQQLWAKLREEQRKSAAVAVDLHRAESALDEQETAHRNAMFQAKRDARVSGFERGVEWVVGLLKKVLHFERLLSRLPTTSFAHQVLAAPDRRETEVVERTVNRAIRQRGEVLPQTPPGLHQWLDGIALEEQLESSRRDPVRVSSPAPLR